MKNCEKIAFSNRACNAIISETVERNPCETGGILLGIIIDSTWFVLESIDPGPNPNRSASYFGYDTSYVIHLAKLISKQYLWKLEVLGFWHRFPGSLDTFPGNHEGKNPTFDIMNAKGIISGIINIDPYLRLTMYDVSSPLRYEKVGFDVGDKFIPEELFKYKHEEERKMIIFKQSCLAHFCRHSLPPDEKSRER